VRSAIDGVVVEGAVPCAATGDDDAASAAFQQSLEVSPSQIEGHMRLGEIYLRQGRGAEAVRAYEAALKVEGSFAEARQQLAAAIALRDQAAGT